MKKFFDYCKKHRAASIIIVIIIIAIGYFWYKKTHNASAAVRYITQAAKKQDLTVTVTGSGQISSSDQVDIKPQASGSVTQVKVQQGQQVNAGDVIAMLDETSAINSINTAKAQVEQQQANYDNVIAGSTSDQVKLGQLAVDSAQQSLDNAKQNYTNVQKTQEQDVSNDYTTLLNSDLALSASDAQTSATVTLSGNYTGSSEGTYTISTYNSEGGSAYTVSGLGNENGVITRGVELPLGDGLYITFGTSGTISPTTVWTIQVPNTSGSSYFTNLNAYNSALQTQAQDLQTAQQQIDSAQNALSQAQVQLDQTVSPPTQAEIEAAQAQLDSAKESLANADLAYENNIIKAPFDGTIATLSVNPGDQASTGTAIATEIANNQVADISLNEVDVPKIKLGDQATLTFDAIDGLTLTGKVAQIDTVGTVSQGVVTYNVEIALDAQNSQVKPGMSTNASIITQVDNNVLTVPNSAIKSDSSGANYVQVLVNGKPQQEPVQVGASNDTDTEITGGLSEGAQVVVQTISGSQAAAVSAPTGAVRGNASPKAGGGRFFFGG